MKILAVSTYLPFPQNHGDALRVLMMLQTLSEIGDLTALSVRRRDSQDADELGWRQNVPDADVMAFDLSPMSRTSSPWNRARRLVTGLARLTPPLFFSPHSAEMEAFIAKEARNFDVIVLLGEAAGVYARHLRGQHVIWDKANVFTAFCFHSVAHLASYRQKCKFLLNGLLSHFYEKRVMKIARAVWVTAPEESPRLEKYFARRPDAVIRSAITAPATNPNQFDANSRSLVWMSTFAYPPNWDGLQRLIVEAEDLFKLHDLRLTVVGAGATEGQIKFLRKFDFVDYLGFVENLDSVFSASVAGVVPIWAGAGVKLKTITMMSRGLPVVSTRAGMEGIPEKSALFVSDSPRELVEALAIHPRELFHIASAKAFATINGEFSGAAFRQSVRSAVRA